jgi:salicylate hydroxylase
VLEQSESFREIGGGIQFCPNVFKIFDYLDLTPKIHDIAFFPESLIYMDGVNNTRYAHIPLRENIVKRFKYPYGVFYRREILQTLIQECKNYPLIQLVVSARVAEIEEKNDKVIVKTTNNQTYEGAALIGCDGIWSVVREYILGKKPPRITRSIAFRGLVPVNEVPEHLRPSSVVHWHMPNSHIVHYPISKTGLFNVVAEIESDEHYVPLETKAYLENFEKIFADSIENVQNLLKYIDKTKVYVLCDREPISNWSQGRITLLGDAAHPTLPHLTQGAGMAIEDAVVIAKHIDECKGDYETAFLNYQKERYLRTSYVQTMAKAYIDVHHATGIYRELRNYFFEKAKPELLYDMLGFLYDGIELPKK